MRRYLLDLIRTGDVPLIAEFDDHVFGLLSGGRGADGPLCARRAVRRLVEVEAAQLEHGISVWTVDGPQPYRRHDARTAGHVLLHPHGHPAEFPVCDTGRDARGRTHEALMAQQHGLRPVPGLSARTLAEFAGQTDAVWPLPGPYESDQGRQRPAWFDHVRTWADRWGDPVLSVEPYRDALDPLRVAGDLAGLSLDLEVHEGVWNDGCTLLLLRLHPERDPLPTVRRPAPDPMGDDRDEYDELLAALTQAEHVARLQQMAAPRLTRSAIAGIVARAVASGGGDTLQWAEGRFAIGEQTGELSSEVFRTLIERLRARFPTTIGTEPAMASVLGAATARAWRSMFSEAAAEVSAALGWDFPARVARLERRYPELVRGTARMRLAATWLAERQQAEAA